MARSWSNNAQWAAPHISDDLPALAGALMQARLTPLPKRLIALAP